VIAVHWLRIEGIVDELYDVITLPSVTSADGASLQDG
jgi:hypothetical protein